MLFRCVPSSAISAPEYTHVWPRRAQKEQTGFSPGHLVFFRLARNQKHTLVFETGHNRTYRQLSQACLARFAGRSPSVGAILVVRPGWFDNAIPRQVLNRFSLLARLRGRMPNTPRWLPRNDVHRAGSDGKMGAGTEVGRQCREGQNRAASPPAPLALVLHDDPASLPPC